MSSEISPSRFHMWRAVFAVAHLDHELTSEELAFAKQYLENVNFSDAQRQVLLEDLETPQSVEEMLEQVSEPTDQADFFQFAGMMSYSDGVASASETALVNKLMAQQKEQVNRDELKKQVRASRKASILRRALEDQEFAGQARDISPFAKILQYVAPVEGGAVPVSEPDDEVFDLWRAVFALVHADGDISEEERDYVEAMMAIFNFSREQRAVIARDLEDFYDVTELFKALKTNSSRRQFFVLARIVVWCDGVFHDAESLALENIREYIGEDNVQDYTPEIELVYKEPESLQAAQSESGQEQMMQDIVKLMNQYYKNKMQDRAA